jgi:hypothetical protein
MRPGARSRLPRRRRCRPPTGGSRSSRGSPPGGRAGRPRSPAQGSEPLADQLAGEHPMLAGVGRRKDLGHVHRVLLGLGRVADRAAGEQTHRPAGQAAGAAVHQLTGRLQPVPGIHRAAEHDRVIAVHPRDLLGRDDRGVEPCSPRTSPIIWAISAVAPYLVAAVTRTRIMRSSGFGCRRRVGCSSRGPDSIPAAAWCRQRRTTRDQRAERPSSPGLFQPRFSSLGWRRRSQRRLP